MEGEIGRGERSRRRRGRDGGPRERRRRRRRIRRRRDGSSKRGGLDVWGEGLGSLQWPPPAPIQLISNQHQFNHMVIDKGFPVNRPQINNQMSTPLRLCCK